jgi:hypothetical protein
MNTGGGDPLGLYNEQARGGGNDTIGSIANYASDPLDLWGVRAGNARSDIRDILTKSAQAGIDEQNKMQSQIDAMQKPFYDSGLKSFGDLTKMATGGGMPEGYQPSALYNLQLDQGNKGITAGQAKNGLLHSSATSQKRSDLGAGLAAEEAQRVYGGALSSTQLGTASADAINAASQSLGGNIGSLYNNLGSSLNANTQAYGQARQNSMNSLSNMFSGASSAYASSQGGK